MESLGYRLTKGAVVGREHMRLWRNSQDAMQAGMGKVGEEEYLYGVVCDGCSEGEHSEIGAKLLAVWMMSEIPICLLAGMKPEDVLPSLYRRAIDYLGGIVRATTMDGATRIEFIRNYLLCTIVGFVMNKTECLVFTAGDGLVAVDDKVIRIDQDNRPSYLGYHLVPRASLQNNASRLPEDFQVWRAENGFDRLVIATDGLEEDALEKLWGIDSDVRLTRELKRLSRAEGRLSDDCSVIMLERIGGGEMRASEDSREIS